MAVSAAENQPPFWARWRERASQAWTEAADRLKASRLMQFLHYRPPAEHARLALSAAGPLAYYGLREASGVSFFRGSYHRLRSFRYPHESYWFAYHKAAAKGHFVSSGELARAREAARVLEHARDFYPGGRLPRSRLVERLEGRLAAPSGFHTGYLAGGVALASNLHLAVQNPYGPFYGFGLNVLSFGLGLPALRLGWGLGAAAGRSTAALWPAAARGMGKLGAGLGQAGRAVTTAGRRGVGLSRVLSASRFSGWQTTGRILRGTSATVGVLGRTLGLLGVGVGKAAEFSLGSRLVAATLTGAATLGGALLGAGLGLVAPLALEYAATELPHLGHRLSRRGFGNLYGPYRDTRLAMTMRQQAVAAISQSQLNARNALGGEAALLHLT